MKLWEEDPEVGRTAYEDEPSMASRVVLKAGTVSEVSRWRGGGEGA